MARSTKTNKPKRDIAQEITDAIVSKLEQGEIPWVKPWDAPDNGPAKRANGEEYRGINRLWLQMDQDDNARTSPFYMTFQQAKTLGAHVKKGESGIPVVFYKQASKEEENDQGEKERKNYFLKKSYTVFNADQIEGLPEKFFPAPKRKERTEQAIADPKIMKALDEMTSGLQLKGGYAEGGNRAFYRRDIDAIRVPEMKTFEKFDDYASTRTHEMAHATEAPSRLNKDWGGQKMFGNTAYARGELYAELTSSFVAAEMGFDQNLDQRAAYLGGWIKALQNDKNEILRMTSHADTAKNHLLEMTSHFNQKARGDFDMEAAQEMEAAEKDAGKKNITPQATEQEPNQGPTKDVVLPKGAEPLILEDAFETWEQTIPKDPRHLDTNNHLQLAAVQPCHLREWQKNGHGTAMEWKGAMVNLLIKRDGEEIRFSVGDEAGGRVDSAKVKREDGTITWLDFQNRQIQSERHGAQAGDYAMGKGHREGKPCAVDYDEKGIATWESWERNGKEYKPNAHEVMAWKKEQAAYGNTLENRRLKDEQVAAREANWDNRNEPEQKIKPKITDLTNRTTPQQLTAAAKAAAARMAPQQDTLPFLKMEKAKRKDISAGAER